MTIGIHWSLLIFGFLAATSIASELLPALVPGASSTSYLVAALLGVLGLFTSVLAHELGHALVAQRNGVEVEGITLWLLGGVARLKSEAQDARAAFAIAAAGPAVSIALAVAGVLAAWVAASVGAADLVVALFGYLGIVNAGLALFNLIPALPLDGGRILQAYLWNRDGDRLDATIRAAGLGKGLAFFGVGIGIVQLLASTGSGLWTILLSFFVMRGASAERRQAEREKRRLAGPQIPDWFDQWKNNRPGPGGPGLRIGDPIPVRSREVPRR